MKQEAAVFLAFIKDKLSFLSVFIINTAIIIIFFNFSLNSNEWLYPSIISMAVFLPYFIVQWFSYRKLMLMMDIGEVNIPEEIYTNKEYLRKINSTIIKIHKNYNINLNEEKQKNIEFRRFISQFIHAMKTPVTVIGLALQKCNDASCGQDMVKDIYEENQRQLIMLNNILEYLRLKDFNKDYTPVSADLCKELTRVINSKKRSFIYNNVRPDITCNSTDSMMVLTDSKWNEAMLDQIISNAIKYSAADNEMKKIDFSIEQLADKTILTVCDHGIGIPEYDINKVMEPFFTGDNGRKIKNATGIGLYMVKLIAESLGHEVSIESQVGVGTKVKIVYYKMQNYHLI